MHSGGNENITLEIFIASEDLEAAEVAELGGGHQALLLAIRMQPDVIFFLTDAEEPRLTPLELEKIKRANQRVGASIHSIEFGAGPSQVSNNFLQRLARSNGGQHTYVDITRLTP